MEFEVWDGWTEHKNPLSIKYQANTGNVRASLIPIQHFFNLTVVRRPNATSRFSDRSSKTTRIILSTGSLVISGRPLEKYRSIQTTKTDPVSSYAILPLSRKCPWRSNTQFSGIATFSFSTPTPTTRGNSMRRAWLAWGASIHPDKCSVRISLLRFMIYNSILRFARWRTQKSRKRSSPSPRRHPS